MLEISCGPVRAVIVTHFVIAVPELVMNVFWPSITHSCVSASSAARVFVLPASEPASASVRPNAPSTSPAIMGTRYSCFCASVPMEKNGDAPRLTPASSVAAIDASTRAISSIAMQYVR